MKKKRGNYPIDKRKMLRAPAKKSFFNFWGLTKFQTSILGFCSIVLFVWFQRMGNRNFNQPAGLILVPAIIITTTIILYNKKSITQELTRLTIPIRIYGYAMTLISSSLMGLLITSVLLIPFYYINEYYAQQHYVITEECEITNVYSKRKNTRFSDAVDFILYSKSNRLYCYTKEMDELTQTGRYNKHTLMVNIRPGLFGTYVLEDWQLARK